jgi:hypothetical protein
MNQLFRTVAAQFACATGCQALRIEDLIKLVGCKNHDYLPKIRQIGLFAPYQMTTF